MNDYDQDEFFEDDFEWSDDEESAEAAEASRPTRQCSWRKIELAKERLALRRELSDFDFGSDDFGFE